MQKQKPNTPTAAQAGGTNTPAGSSAAKIAALKAKQALAALDGAISDADDLAERARRADEEIREAQRRRRDCCGCGC